MYFSVDLGCVFAWVPLSNLSSKSSHATVTSSSLSGLMFSTPATKIDGALEVFLFVSPPHSTFSSPDSASNLLLFDGDGCFSQQPFSLICITFCEGFSGVSLGRFLYSTFCHGDGVSVSGGKDVSYCCCTMECM